MSVSPCQSPERSIASRLQVPAVPVKGEEPMHLVASEVLDAKVAV